LLLMNLLEMSLRTDGPVVKSHLDTGALLQYASVPTVPNPL
jgi:hypothetical protein